MSSLLTVKELIACYKKLGTQFSPKMRRLKPKAPNVDMPSTLCLALTPLLLSLNPLWKISAILLLTNLSIILLWALMVGGHMSLNLFLTAFYVLVWTSMFSVRKLVISLLPFTTPIPPLFLKVSHVRLSVYVLLPFSQYPTVSTL